MKTRLKKDLTGKYLSHAKKNAASTGEICNGLTVIVGMHSGALTSAVSTSAVSLWLIFTVTSRGDKMIFNKLQRSFQG
ncbi:MAG: hypothetical protein LBR08_13460 [Bacteroidales bacterium]|nr:hypothetical protein [Bacteroidales bacterium]